MKRRPLTIFVDIDEVVADLITEWLRRYNADYHDHLRKDDMTGWDIHHFVQPDCGTKIYDYLHDDDLYVNVEPVPGAVEGVRALRDDGHRVVFASSCVFGMTDQKWKWLFRQGLLPSDRTAPDFLPVTDKGLLRGDVLLDDRTDNLKAFQGFGIVFDEPWNQDAAFLRVYTWPVAVRLIDSIARGKP